MLNPISKFGLVLLIFLQAAQAADCTSPAAPEGTLQWIAASSVVKFCNGAAWIDTSHGSLGSCAGTTAGTIGYSASVARFCDGTNWISMKNTTSFGTCTTAGLISYNPGNNKLSFCDGTTLWDMGQGATCTAILTNTTGTTWAKPANWDNTSNTIQVIGAGGGGSNTNNPSGGAGGGGGAYAKIANQTLTGTSFYYKVAAGGAAGTSAGNSYFCAALATDCGTGGAAVWAKGGSGASGLTGGTGAPATGTGTLQTAGGNGMTNAAAPKGTGGGGAGGGAGAGLAGGVQIGGRGDAGSGGAGGAAGAVGGAGTESGAAGSGGGGGGGNTNMDGGAGGAYGGGGGGAGKNTGKNGGVGGQGVIIINYTSATTCP